jgi:hypothetical protein
MMAERICLLHRQKPIPSLAWAGTSHLRNANYFHFHSGDDLPYSPGEFYGEFHEAQLAEKGDGLKRADRRGRAEREETEPLVVERM